MYLENNVTIDHVNKAYDILLNSTLSSMKLSGVFEYKQAEVFRNLERDNSIAFQNYWLSN